VSRGPRSFFIVRSPRFQDGGCGPMKVSDWTPAPGDEFFTVFSKSWPTAVSWVAQAVEEHCIKRAPSKSESGVVCDAISEPTTSFQLEKSVPSAIPRCQSRWFTKSDITSLIRVGSPGVFVRS